MFLYATRKNTYTRNTPPLKGGENAKQVQEYLSSLGKLFPDDFSFICRKVTITPQFLRHRLHHFHTRLISRQWCCIDAHINLENWRARLSRSKPNHFYPVVLKKSWRSVAFIFIMLKKEITNWYFIFRTSSFWLCYKIISAKLKIAERLKLHRYLIRDWMKIKKECSTLKIIGVSSIYEYNQNIFHQIVLTWIFLLKVEKMPLKKRSKQSFYIDMLKKNIWWKEKEFNLKIKRSEHLENSLHVLSRDIYICKKFWNEVNTPPYLAGFSWNIIPCLLAHKLNCSHS